MHNSKLKADIINFLDETVKTFLAETSTITFDKYDPQHLYLMCLYGRIFELGVSTINLMKANDHAGVPIIMRSQLEAFVDFANLIEDRDFINTIAATFIEQKKRQYENIKKYLDPSEVPPITDEFQDIAPKGHKGQNIWKKFKNIKLQKTYMNAYFILCSYSHNNLDMIEHRHLDKTGNQHKVVFFKEEPIVICLRFALTLGATLVDAHTNLLAFFDKPMKSKSKKICSEFAKLRENTKIFFKNEL